ncbi:stomatin-like protein 1 [Xenia sp. Carnegie-2017]|uniref:stomatin-like protein 1 n=1 Tax=Xenia sp. Carnegie-2017 TaxID=2897299 RepID=UPI001F035378|nr:stomatin-like protein 1 [Xenia sp. Carnegie-2017]
MDSKYSFFRVHDRSRLYREDNLCTEKQSANKTVDVVTWAITFLVYILAVFTFPLSCFCCVKVIQEYERAVVLRLGRLQPLKEPGITFILPCIDKFHRVDIRIKAFNVPPQKILTKDQAAVLVGATVQFLIQDPIALTGNVQDLNHSMRVLAQTTLVNILTTQNLIEIQNDKKFTAIRAQDELNKVTRSWGVQIHRIEISEAQVISAPPEYNPDISSLFKADNNPISTIFQVMQGALGGLPPQVRPVQKPVDSSLDAVSRTSNEQIPYSRLPDPDQLIAIFNHVTDERLVRDIGCVYQFNFSDLGSTWYVDLKNDEGHGGKGPPCGCTPDVVITLSSHDMRALFSGEISAFDAYMHGRVNITGDVRMAMKLQVVVERMNQSRSSHVEHMNTRTGIKSSTSRNYDSTNTNDIIIV